ncbi:MAG: DUF2510 domain-containing protein, partial [Marmoricola sp.]
MSDDWYPDPLGRAQLRFHDGSGWTHHVATTGQQSVAPADFPLAPPVYAPPAPATPSRPGSG